MPPKTVLSSLVHHDKIWQISNDQSRCGRLRNNQWSFIIDFTDSDYKPSAVGTMANETHNETKNEKMKRNIVLDKPKH